MKKADGFYIIETLAILLILAVIVTIGIIIGRYYNYSYEPQPDPYSPQISSLRDQTITKIDTQFASVKKDSSLHYYAKGKEDICYAGMHGSLFGGHVDNFDYQCAMDITEYYGFNGDFSTTLTQLQAILSSLGWNVNQTYYNQSVSQTVGYYAKPDPKIPSSYLNGGMGPFRDGSLSLNMSYEDYRYAEFNPTALDVDESLDISNQSFYKRSNYVQDTSLIKTISKSDQYILDISLSTNYFTE